MAPERRQPHRQRTHRARKGARTLIPFDRFLTEAEQLRATAIEMLRRDGHHAPICILFTDVGTEFIGLWLARTSGRASQARSSLDLA